MKVRLTGVVYDPPKDWSKLEFAMYEALGGLGSCKALPDGMRIVYPNDHTDPEDIVRYLKREGCRVVETRTTIETI